MNWAGLALLVNWLVDPKGLFSYFQHVFVSGFNFVLQFFMLIYYGLGDVNCDRNSRFVHKFGLLNYHCTVVCLMIKFTTSVVNFFTYVRYVLLHDD